MPDFVGNTTGTAASITVGTPVTGALETLGDHDWYAVTLTPGQSIFISLAGTGATPLEDTVLVLRDSTGTIIAENDDLGSSLSSGLIFTATTGGTYYLDVGGFDDSETGDFQLTVSNYVPILHTNDQIADYLVDGFWEGNVHRFNVDQGGEITVNITGLNTAGQFFARSALQMWSDIIGVTFSEVATGGSIIFDDTFVDEAWADAVWDGSGFITSVEVNVGTNWIAGDGMTLNSYSFQTYLHEIGHALGLGHAGNYDGNADFLLDSHYDNEAWSTTVMSYFSQEDNPYFAGLGFTYNYIMSPMAADIVAMSLLYGLSTTTRTENTVYGFGSTAGRDTFDATANPGAGYTVFDNGGIDTLNYSGHATNQLINLNPETFSNVGGQVGNVSIARGTVIENATGGGGHDTLVGNAANNVLNGGTGTDTASYAAAGAAVTVSLATAAAQNTLGAGTDTLTSIESLTGSNFNDTLTGNGGANTLNGGAGNDNLRAGAGNDSLLGGEGNDTLDGGAGNDQINGGNGIDRVSYSTATAAVTVNLATAGAQNTVGAGTDTLTGIEYLTGSNFNDSLTGNTGANSIFGAGGNDTIVGGDGIDTLEGGTGNDLLNGGAGIDTASYSTATAGVTVNLTTVAAQNTVGAGTDTLSGIENATGSAFSDSLTGTTGGNWLTGGAGNDTLLAGDGHDTLDGGAGNDIINGGTGIDRATYAFATAGVTVNIGVGAAQNTVGAGTDTLSGIEYLTGSNHNDTLTGNTLANTLIGLNGNDSLTSGDGTDTLDGGLGNDIMNGGNGTDTATYASMLAGVTVNLAIAGAQNTVGAGTDTLTGIENLTGSRYSDTLSGNAVANTINAGIGNDTIRGGSGNDTLTGGAGYDVFHFNTALNGTTNVDTITDFSAVHDTIRLTRTVFTALGTGILSTAAFRAGVNATDASDRIIYDNATGNIYYDADGNGGGAKILFAKVAIGTVLSNVDFSVVASAEAPDKSLVADQLAPSGAQEESVELFPGNPGQLPAGLGGRASIFEALSGFDSPYIHFDTGQFGHPLEYLLV